MDRTIALVLVAAAIGGAMTYKGFVSRRPATAIVDEVAETAMPAPVPSSASTAAPSPVGGKSCAAKDLRLEWPLRGVAEKDFFIANYFDQDPLVNQTRDYTGATGLTAITYDGHTGIDIELASFRSMDAGFPIYSSAPGIVEEIHDGSFDRNMTCSSDLWNFVRIRHANGYSTTYGHAKKDSIIVRPGDHVTSGQKLANVGSSGCSGYPHLHIEAADCTGRAVDIIKENLFIVPPGYAPQQPATLMETLIRQPVIRVVADIQDPGPSDTPQIELGVAFSAAMTVSHLKAGDVIRIDFIDPLNQPAAFFYENKIDKAYSRSHWWADFILKTPGSWLVQFKINDRMVFSERLQARE